MYDIKALFEPVNLEEALTLLHEHPESMVINGGTDVLIKSREGHLPDASLVSIVNLAELKQIEVNEHGNIVIGGGVCFTAIENHELIRKHMDFLGYSASQIGGPQIRNMGTMGGNICNGVPSADTCTPLLAMDALLHLKSVREERVLPMSEFYLGPGKTNRQRDEILTYFEIPNQNYEGYKGSYFKYAMRKAMDIATVCCCVMTKLSSDKDRLEDVKITYGVAAPTPIRSPKLEELLRGQAIDEKLMDIIDQNYALDVKPRDSWRASKDFRLEIIKEITKRNLNRTIVEGGGTHVYRD